MVDFFKHVLVGVAILIQSIGHIVGIKSDLPKFNHPSPSPIVVASPTPLNSPSPIPTISPKANNNQLDNSNSQAKEVQDVTTHDGTRTGNIVKYKEWCKGNQEISVFENELITKKASDGNTFTFTQGDWNCYEKSMVNCQLGDKWIVMQKPLCDKTQAELSKQSTTQIPINAVQQVTQINNPGKTAEMRNLIAEAKRLAAIRDDALVKLNWYLKNQPHCSRPVYVDGTDIPLRPDQSEQIYQSCLSITQPSINQYSDIVADANSKLRDVEYKLNILVAECPKCWEEAKK